MDIMTLAAAKSYTDKKTANGGAADLSNYYTKQEIDDKEFVTQDQLPEGYVVDDSLTIDGAAADAKATGDRFAEHYTKQEIDDKGFTTTSQMTEYVTAAINGSLDEIEAMIDESGVLDE